MKAPSLAIDHIALPIFDVAGTLSFYTDVLGLPLLSAFSGDDWNGKEWLMMIFLLGDGRQVVLVALRGVSSAAAGELPADTHHIAFSAAGEAELESWRCRLRDHRVDFREEDHGAQRSIYFEDPNRIVLEVTAPPSHPAARPDREAAQVVRSWISGKV
jgi:catechol 2,3-dioxygenase-like lactoylglutathione lyase family enzyme